MKTIRQITAGLILTLFFTGTCNALDFVIDTDKESTQIYTKNSQKELQRDFTDKEVKQIQEIQRNAPKRNLKYLGQFKLTAYCPCVECSDNWGRKTKTGTTAIEGRTIAVDPDIIPLNSKIYINGNEYIAEDIGGAVKGNMIDIYFDNHSDVDKFGVTHANIMMKKEQEDE